MNSDKAGNEIIKEVNDKITKRGCLFYVKRGLKYFSVMLILVIVTGVTFQTLATESDKRTYSPRGELYTVNGHQMHMICMGEGSPTVILQAGATAESLWWYRVQNQIAEQTRVCAYDRPGMGWSEEVSGKRDVLTLVSEWHSLLQQANIEAPYIVVGHSFGAILSRVFAAQYPQESAGIVLVDSEPVSPKHFATQAEYEQWKTLYDVIMIPFSVITQTGGMRLMQMGEFAKDGYPPELVPELVAFQTRNQSIGVYYAENFPVFQELQDASAKAENLGSTPMVVLWAQESAAVFANDEARDHFYAMQDEIASYSSNSATRYVEGANHLSILGNETYSHEVSNAVFDVIQAAQTGTAVAQ